jgi:hypothetical protein
MKNHFLNRLYLYTAALFFVIALIAVPVYCDSPASVSDAYITPPVTAAEDITDEYGVRIGTDIGIYEDDEYYLFLPSTADLSCVKLRYDGSLQLYKPDDGSLYNSGETVEFNCTSGTINIYEYDSEKNLYNRYSLTVMKGENIATMYITLDNGDKGLRNINSSHDAVETGKLVMTEANGKNIYAGDLTRMKGHGLTSYQSTGSLNTKNSYNINLADKAELIEGADKSKKWSLLRIRTTGNYDATGVSYPMGFYIYNALAGKEYFNITSRFVNVYIDGEYRGVYILTERMDMNGSIQITDLEEQTTYTSDRSGRIDKNKKNDPAIAAGIEYYCYCTSATTADDTDISGGYVLEIMCGTTGEYGFKTKKGMYINVKSPSHPSYEQVQYIAEYIQNFENALFSNTGYNSLGKHYTEYIDVQSYAMQALTYSFCLNWEIYRTSTYMYKDADSVSEKVTFGPVWDFESGPSIFEEDKTVFGTTFAYNERQQYIWYEQFWQKAEFMEYITGMNEEMKSVVDILVGEAEGTRIFSLSYMLDYIQSSQEMNWIRWSQTSSFTRAAKKMNDAVATRYRCWYIKLWNPDNYMLGADVTSEKNEDGYVLTANAIGKVYGYQWYKLDMSSPSEGEKIEGATDKTYTATDDGIYYCAVNGRNNAYWEWASGKVFSKEDITMYTDPIYADGRKADGIVDLDPYVLGEAPKNTAGISTYSEYVPKKTADTEEIYAAEDVNVDEQYYEVTDMDVVFIAAASALAVASIAVICVCVFTKKKGGSTNV